jgi:hypothetical protein
MKLYETREEAAQGCRVSAKTAERYAKAAERFAKEGRKTSAWNMADTAKTAADCAMQAHEVLWNLTGGRLTDEEFEAFEQAEIAQTNARKAAGTAANC